MISAKGVKATGYESPEGFVVKEGSQAVADEVPSIHAYLSTFRKERLQ
jgi:hypothetical protein